MKKNAKTFMELKLKKKLRDVNNHESLMNISKDEKK